MPKQGLQMTEGTITSWYVQEGEPVTEGEPLFEIETDKLTITIDANHSGTLLKILHQEGDVVPVAEPIGIIGEPGEDYSNLLSGLNASNAEDQTSSEQLKGEESKEERREADLSTEETSSRRILSTPRARLRAEELGVDLAVIVGTGPEGLITEKDVLAYAQTVKTTKEEASSRTEAIAAPNVAESLSDKETSIPLTNMRRIIAQRMHESLSTMAQANHRITVDMTQAVELRKQFMDNNIKVSYNDIIIRCVARALTEFPELNSSLTETSIVRKHYVNIGMAVAVPEGLIVPVLKDADRMSLAEIAIQTSDLALRAREGKLQEEDCTGGTFTVTNLGMYDIDSFTAIINPPEVGILAVGKISKQVVVGDEDKIEIKPLMVLSLTYDHRVVDGAPAARFLKRVKQLLEHPLLLI